MERPLNRFCYNIHSQYGEDGVLEEIFKRIGPNDSHERWCVEFGAWDGRYLSNTLALVKNGWNAVYIEGDKEKFSDLLMTVKEFPLVVPICAMVEADYDHANNLDVLLDDTRLPQDYDLLSIDVDSFDLDIWETHERRPKVVVIEINSNVIPGIIWRHSEKTNGNTFSATINVGLDKGYTCVCHTLNLFFVRNDLINRIGIDDRFIKFPDLLFDQRFIMECGGINYRHPPPSTQLKKLIPKSLKPIIKNILFALTKKKRFKV